MTYATKALIDINETTSLIKSVFGTPNNRKLSMISSDRSCVWLSIITSYVSVNMINTLRPRQNGRHFAYGTFKRIFLNENGRLSIEISLKLVPKDPINNIPALIQIMTWRWPGDKPLSEPIMVRLLMHICITRPEWVKTSVKYAIDIYIYIKLNWILISSNLILSKDW